MENRRIQMTKRLLKLSVLNILENKPLNKITIKEICADADINRTTFYKYYNDQYSLVGEIENDIFNQIHGLFNCLNAGDEKVTVLERFLIYLRSNKNTVRILMNGNCQTKFENRLKKYIAEQTHNAKFSNDINKESKKYVCLMIASGAIDAVCMWINSNCEKDENDIAKLIINVGAYGLQGVC